MTTRGPLLLLLVCCFNPSFAQPTVLYPLPDGSTTVSLDEGPPLTNVLTVLGTGIDTVTVDDVEDAATGASKTSEFTVSAATVKTTVPLDYETTATYTMTLKVRDTTGASVPVQFTIQVNNKPDEAPVFDASNTYSVSWFEEQVPRSQVFPPFVITDPDTADTHTFSLTGAHASYFTADPKTGAIVVNTQLDRDAAGAITVFGPLILTVTDSGGNSASQTLTVTLVDVNDNAPECSPALYTPPPVAENTGDSTFVAMLTCNDIDTTSNGATITYSIISGDDATPKFKTNGNKVETTANPLDYEAATSYTLVVHAIDNGTPTPMTGTATVVVQVTGVNEFDPVWATFTPAGPTFTKPEDVAVGTQVVTITATDSDAGPDGEVFYSLVSVTDAGNSPANGILHIDQTTGVIKINSPLDYDADVDKQTYTFVVKAEDRGTTPSAKSALKTLTLSVQNVNDNDPVFSATSYSATIDETNARTTVWAGHQLIATDADLPGGSLLYQITGGNSLDKFAFSGTTDGLLELKSAIDVDFPIQDPYIYYLTVQVSEQGVLGTPIRTDIATVIITITPMTNDHDPELGTPTPSASPTISEMTNIGTTIASFPSATDNDRINGSRQGMTFAITAGNTNNDFTIDTTLGVVTTANALDYERTDSYTLTIAAVDTSTSPRTRSTTLTVTVTNVNELAPSCTTSSVVTSIVEEGAAQQVATFTCSDGDTGDSVEFTIFPAVANFGVDINSGVVSTLTGLDYEIATSHTVLIEVKDTLTPSLTSTVTLIVNVEPVNEFDPAFPVLSYTATLPEDAAAGTSVTTVAATDADTGALHGTIRYNIMAGNGLGAFTIDETTGEITVAADGLLDREDTATHTLTVRASDDMPGAATERTANATVVITITDINDNTPLCTPDSYQVNLVETTLVGAVFKTLTVNDDDEVGNPNSMTTLMITGGDPGSIFVVNGLDLVLAKTVDYDASQTSYSLTLTVTDTGSSPRYSTCSVQVNILPANEFNPVFTVPNAIATLNESTPVGYIVYTATATDADTGVGSTLTYDIISGNTNNDFYGYTDGAAGKVVVWKQLDYDTPPQVYNLTVEARDDAGLTDTFWLHITLTGLNDETPVFSQNRYSFRVDENVPSNTLVDTVTATDSDPGVEGSVKYTAVSGNGMPYFTVDQGTGGITTTTDTLDREVRREYHLVIEAADGGNPSLSSSVLVVISLNDVNDNPPIFTPDDFTVSVSETMSTGTTVANVTASDADATASRNTFSFQLSHTHFEVEASGAVTNKLALDRETAASHVVTVTAPDADSVHTGTATITILINDVNDNDPVISGTYTPRIYEDAVIGDIVTTVTATDADDGDNARLTYAIVGGNTDNDFVISPVNGVIQVRNTLNRERTNSYTLEVEVSDNGPSQRTTTTLVNVTIKDINDHAPVWTSSSYSFTVPENKPAEKSVGEVSATDKDISSNAALTYSFVRFWTGNGAHLTMDGDTGKVKTLTELDRESIPEYTALVQVTDGGNPQFSAEINVTIAVTDENDNKPVFDQVSYSSTTVEHDPVGTSVMTVTITDDDIGVNDDINLYIDTSTPEGLKADTFFQVTSASGVWDVSVKSDIDRETDPSFSFTLLAVDGGTPAQNSSANVTITVIDINDHSPIFTETYYNMAMDYAGKCTKSIVTVTATDKDIGTNGEVSYYLQPSSYGHLFNVHAVSGEVSMESSLTAGVLYILTVSARDGGDPTNTATTPVVVRVDAMVPNNVVLTFKLGIPVDAFQTQQSSFLNELQVVMRQSYPTAVAKLWCVETNSDGLADVHVYFLQDNSTEADKDTAKYYVAQDTARAEFTSDAEGTPGPVLQGSEWSPFDVKAVHPYVESQTPWEETTEGIAIITVAALIGLALLATAIYMFVRYCRRMRCRRPPPRKIVVEEKPPPPRKSVEPLPRRIRKPETPLSNYKGDHFWDTSFQP